MEDVCVRVVGQEDARDAVAQRGSGPHESLQLFIVGRRGRQESLARDDVVTHLPSPLPPPVAGRFN